MPTTFQTGAGQGPAGPPGSPGAILLATQTPSAAASATFSGIVQTSRHLLLIGSITMSNNLDLLMQFNGATGAAYQWEKVFFSGATVTASNNGSDTSIHIATSNGAGATLGFEIWLPNYTIAARTGHAVGMTISQNANTNVILMSNNGGFWSGAAAITSIALSVSAGTITGQIDLYGI